MIPYEQTTEDCLKEMFKRVGEEFPNKELTDKQNWYTLRTWTEEEENNFRKWMEGHLKKRYSMTQKKRDSEIGMFLLNWGWKTEME